MDSFAIFHGASFFCRERPYGVIVEAPRPAILVVNRYPKMPMYRMVTSGRDHREARHDPRRDAPIIFAVFCIPARPDVKTTGLLNNLKYWPRILQVVLISLCALE